MRALFTLTAVLLLAATAVRAQWEQIDNLNFNPPHYGGLVASDSSYLYQTVIFGPPTQVAFFRSSDNGATWSRSVSFSLVASTVPKFLSATRGFVIMTCSDVPADSGVFLVSTDFGNRWREVKTTAGIDIRMVQQIGIGTYMAGIASRNPIRSTDGGDTWNPVMTGPADLSQVRAIGNTAVALTSPGFIYRSTDRGAHWEQVKIDPEAPSVFNLATSLWVSDGKFMVKKTGGSMFVSTDGATWTARPGPVDDLAYTTVETSPNGKMWLLSGGDALYLSTDGGVTAVDVSAGYPRDGSTFCRGDFALTNTAAHAAAICGGTSGGSPSSGTGTYRLFPAVASTGEDAVDTKAGMDLRVTPSGGLWRLEFAVPASTGVRITVHDESGRHVATVLDGDYDAGSHAALYDADVLPSGMYWLRMESEGKSVTRGMSVVK